MHEVGYDHGETSLHDVVKGMASALRHNTPLLEGLGSFESKLSNSSAQPRYLSVRMNALLPLLFRAADQRHVDQDPVTQQPLFLMPVLPPLLLNSSRGLCSGFKGHVPPFHPADVALLVTEALRALRERAEDPQAWVQRYGQLWSLRELRCGGCTLEERGATLEEIFPWFRDAPGAYLFVKSARMAPRCWMGENNENVSVNWKKQEKDEPLGVPPARVQQVVVDYLVPIALRERYRVCSPEPREKLIRLESDHLQRQPVCDLPGATWTMGVLSPWSYQDDVLDRMADEEELVFFFSFPSPPLLLPSQPPFSTSSARTPSWKGRTRGTGAGGEGTPT